MIAQVEAALASVISEQADADLRSKIGLFMADHPGLLARAAIEAMREPTEQMVIQAYENSHEADSARLDSNIDFAAPTWRAMIDAALGK